MQAAREQAAREQAAREQAAREQAAHESREGPPPPPPPRGEQLPQGWKSAKDNQGRSYYYNRSTGEVQYELPNLAESPPPRPPQRRSSTDKQEPSSSAADFSGEQRREHIIRLRAMAQYSTGEKKAEVMGELGVLERRECKRARRE